MDPAAEQDRHQTSNYQTFGVPLEPSYLAASQRTWGNLRQTACTRPTPAPAFYPPEKGGMVGAGS